MACDKEQSPISQPPGLATRDGNVGADPSRKLLRTVLSNLGCLVKGLERCYGILLPLPTFNSISAVKEFCSGLLDPSCLDHEWRDPMCELSEFTRTSIAGSLFLFRKTLPSVKPSVDAYLDKMSSPSNPVSPDYLRHVEKIVKEVFPGGWDKKVYRGAVYGTVPSISSCREMSRALGGARAAEFSVQLCAFNGRSDFCKSALYRNGIVRDVGTVDVTVAPTDGKYRIVSKMTNRALLLKPVHSAMYDHLSTTSWCLRGEAETKSFKEFLSKKGEVFVSGDYESATDNLNLDVARHILQVVLRSSTGIPSHVIEMCYQSLQVHMRHGSRDEVQQRGQLMGNYLSFPLLCLQNYCAFRFFVTDPSVPVAINGDDIVFRSSRSVANTWMDGVRSTGLCLSRGKTLVSSRIFSLNSTFFKASPLRLRLVPVIRSTQLFKPVESPSAIAGRFLSFARGFTGDRRHEWLLLLLNRLRSAIWKSQRSLRRGLGLPVSDRLLVDSGLWRREAFYLGLPKESPLPTVDVGYTQEVVPKGWYSTTISKPTEKHLSQNKAFSRLLVERAWSVPLSYSVGKELWDSWKGGPDCREWFSSYHRFARLTHLSVRCVNRLLKGSVRFPKRKRGVRVWFPPEGDECVGLVVEDGQHESEGTLFPKPSVQHPPVKSPRGLNLRCGVDGNQLVILRR